MANVIRVRKTRRRNRKGNPWVLRWHDKNGRGTQMTIGPMSERFAEKQRQMLQAHLNSLLGTNDVPTTFEEFQAAYVARTEAELAPQSAGLAKWTLQRFAKYMQPELLAGVGPREAEKYKMMRLREVAGTTVAKELRVLHAAFSWAAKQGYVPANPFAGVKVARAVPKSKPILTPEQCQALLTVADRRGSVFHTFVALALETGMRISELANLERADLDFSNHLVRVRAKTEWAPKGRRERVVAVSEETAGLLFELRGREPYTLAGTNREDWKREMRQELKSSCREAGVPVVTPHDLRRTAATMMALAGVPMDVAQQVLGHRSYQTTQEYYVRIAGEEAARMAVRLVRERAKLARGCDLSVTRGSEPPSD